MAGARRLLRRETLEAFSRPLLGRLLAPHREALVRAGVDVDGLAHPQGDPDRDAPLVALYRLTCKPDGQLPQALCDALVDLDAVATSAGHDALTAALSASALSALSATNVPSLGAASAADVALSALLDQPSAFRSARVRVASDAPARYHEYDGETGRVPGDPEAHGPALEAALSRWFDAQRRSAYTDVFCVRTDAEIVWEITHGTLLRQVSLVAEGRRTHQPQRPTKRDLCILDRATGRLAIRACMPTEREMYRKTFGATLFQDEHHYALRPTLDLAPLGHAGAVPPTAGVGAVRVLELTMLTDGRRTTWLRDAEDLTPYLQTDEGRDLRARSVVQAAILGFVFPHRRGLYRVEIAPPNALRCDHRDGAAEAQVKALLVARGILSPPRGRVDGRLAAGA